MNIRRTPTPSRLVVRLATVALATVGLQACGGGGGGGDAAPAALTFAECFGLQARVTPGVTMAYDYRSSAFDAQGNVTQSANSRWTQFANADVVFEGESRSESVVRQNLSESPQVIFELETRSYLSISSATTATFYGSIERLSNGVPGDITVREMRSVATSPPAVDMGGGVGSSVSDVTEGNTTTTVTTNGVAQPATTGTESSTGTLTFSAVETITVPAGTYSTCRLEGRADGSEGTSITWYIPGTGVGARSEGYGADGKLTFRSELTSLTRNGTPL
jgi:hypothetical protein